jgi:hypothetical protein
MVRVEQGDVEQDTGIFFAYHGEVCFTPEAQLGDSYEQVGWTFSLGQRAHMRYRTRWIEGQSGLRTFL